MNKSKTLIDKHKTLLDKMKTGSGLCKQEWETRIKQKTGIRKRVIRENGRQK